MIQEVWDGNKRSSPDENRGVYSAVAIGDAVTTELLKKRSADHPVEQGESTCPQCGKLSCYQGKRH